MADPWAEFPVVEAKGDPWADFPVVEQKQQSAFERAAAGTPVKTKTRYSLLDEEQGLPAETTYEQPQVKPGDFNFSAAFKQSLLRDPKTQIRVVAQDLFPNDPKAEDRFGFINGRLAYADSDGQLKYASGKAAEFLGSLLGNTPEIVAGTVGSLTTSPVIGGTAGVVGARGIKNAVAASIFDEPQTISGNLKDLALVGATEMGGGLVAKGGLAAANRGRVVDVTPANLGQAQAKQAAIKGETGVDVDLALASGDKRLLALRNFLAQQPNETASKIQAADQLASGQFDEATKRVLDLVANPAPADVAGAAGVNAAQDAIRTVRKSVSAQVDPLYKAAYKAVPVIDRTTKQGEAILDYLKLPYFQQAFRDGQTLRALETGSAKAPRTRVSDTISKGGPESFEKASTIVSSTPTGAKQITSRLESGSTSDVAEGKLVHREVTEHRDITRPSLEELDYTKRSLDERIEKLFESGQRQRARALKIKRDEFVQALDSLPNQQWQAARKAYGELAEKEIAPLENGVVGVLAKIKDPKAATAAAKLFRDENVTAGEVFRARKAIEAESKEAWQGLARQYIAKEFNAAKRVTQGGSEVNVSGKLHQRIWGDPAARARMNAALGKDASDALRGLMETAETLGQAPIRGSNTQPNLAIQTMLEGPSGFWMKAVLNPRSTLVQGATKNAVEANSAKLWEALSDPAKVKQLKFAVRISDPARRATFITATILGQSTRAAAGPARSNESTQQ
jgi:hypothetical protein